MKPQTIGRSGKDKPWALTRVSSFLSYSNSYIHTSIHQYIHTFIYICMHTYIHMRPCIHKKWYAPCVSCNTHTHAHTQGDLSKQALPKWYAPYGFRGPCQPDPSSMGKKGPHPTATQLFPDSPDFPADETGISCGCVCVCLLCACVCACAV
jgi:hypothetical protein